MASPSDKEENQTSQSETELEAPRKASDVLISLEQKFDLMIKMYASADLNSRLVLDRLNKICSLLEKVEGTYTASQPTVEADVPPPVISEQPMVVTDLKENVPKGARRTARPETYSEAKGGKVVPVQQKVYDPSGKSVFMAEVEIFTVDGEQVAKLRTTAGGKWQAPLPSGDYSVTVVKRENGPRKRMEYSGTFTVAPSDTPLEIEQAKLEFV